MSDVTEIKIDSGLGTIPDALRDALWDAAQIAESTLTLSNGGTALFYALVSTVNRHNAKLGRE